MGLRTTCALLSPGWATLSFLILNVRPWKMAHGVMWVKWDVSIKPLYMWSHFTCPYRQKLKPPEVPENHLAKAEHLLSHAVIYAPVTSGFVILQTMVTIPYAFVDWPHECSKQRLCNTQTTTFCIWENGQYSECLQVSQLLGCEMEIIV